MPHLFVDISSHGFGHLAQTAPILNALRRLCPQLRLTVRTGLPEKQTRSRIDSPFTFINESSDFGFAMVNAVSIDPVTTANRYQAFHATWQDRVGMEAHQLLELRPDLVLTDVAYLPLAGAAQAGIPAISMCSLNWAELFAHFFGHLPWANTIYAEMLSAYNAAEYFLRLIPAMPMETLDNTIAIAPVASLGTRRTDMLQQVLPCQTTDKIVLIAFGGIDHSLKLEHWPQLPGIHWLVPQAWLARRRDMSAFEPLGIDFTDLLASVDAVLTKPGYGTFVEAACNGTAILYQRREDWPEQECLIKWLHQHARCTEITTNALLSGDIAPALETLWLAPTPPRPAPLGITQAAKFLLQRITAGKQNASINTRFQTRAIP